MKKQIITTAAAMAVTALMAFQPMTAFAATGNCGNGSYHNGCSTQVCQSYGCDTRNCGTGYNSGLTGISRKNLFGGTCSSPQVISYVMRSASCRR